MPPYHVYVLLDATQRHSYVGCTTDVQRRLRQHNGQLKRGAKCTRAHRPWHVALTVGPFPGRSPAQVFEARAKAVRGHGAVRVEAVRLLSLP